MRSLTRGKMRALYRAIPRIPMVPELKLARAILGERGWGDCDVLVGVYCDLYPLEDDWEEYKQGCVRWVTSISRRAASAATEPLRAPIAALLDQLDDRHRLVIRLRFGFVDGRSRTLEATGIELGVTRERARQMEIRALRRFRHPSRSRQIRRYNLWGYLVEEIYAKCKRAADPPVLFELWQYDRGLASAAAEESERVIQELGERIDYLEGLIKKAFHLSITEPDLSIRGENKVRILSYFRNHSGEVYRPPQILRELVGKMRWDRGPNSLYENIMDLAKAGQLGRLRVCSHVYYGSLQAIEALRLQTEEGELQRERGQG